MVIKILNVHDLENVAAKTEVCNRDTHPRP